jgi:hypothetical protein
MPLYRSLMFYELCRRKCKLNTIKVKDIDEVYRAVGRGGVGVGLPTPHRKRLLLWKHPAGQTPQGSNKKIGGLAEVRRALHSAPRLLEGNNADWPAGTLHPFTQLEGNWMFIEALTLLLRDVRNKQIQILSIFSKYSSYLITVKLRSIVPGYIVQFLWSVNKSYLT